MELRKCECCGRELTIDHFAKKTLGLSKICRECHGKKIKEARQKKHDAEDAEQRVLNARNLRLKDFTPRELMEELARRGYAGKLTFTQVHEIDITNF